MRTYQTDSPQARARILALAMVVDGHLDPTELKVLESTPLLLDVEIPASLFREVLETLCSDILHTAVRNGSVEINAALLDCMLVEIADPELRRKMLGAMIMIVAADSWVADGEGMLLARACHLWKADRAFIDSPCASAA